VKILKLLLDNLGNAMKSLKLDNSNRDLKKKKDNSNRQLKPSYICDFFPFEIELHMIINK